MLCFARSLVNCAAGYYSSGSGAIVCTSCATGYQSFSGSVECDTCEDGYFWGLGPNMTDSQVGDGDDNTEG